MGAGAASFIRMLVADEVKHRVADAATDGEALDFKASAVEIASAYPGSGLTEEDISKAMRDEASRAGVSIDGLLSLTKAA